MERLLVVSEGFPFLVGPTFWLVSSIIFLSTSSMGDAVGVSSGCSKFAGLVGLLVAILTFQDQGQVPMGLGDLLRSGQKAY